MEVDQVQIQSDLLALRQLYGLLQNIIGFGVPNISLENAGKVLDKKALQLLKNLLDGARERLSKRLSTDLQNHVVYSEPSKLSFSSNRKPKFPIGNSSTDLSSTSLVMDKKLLPEFSKEVAEAILEIDSRVLALRNLMMKLNRVKNYKESLMEEKYKTSYDEIPSRIESMSRGTIYVNGLRVPVSHDDRGDPSTRPNCGNVDRIINPTVRKASSTSRKTTRSGGHDQRKIIMRPTLLMDDRQENQRRSSRVMSSDSSSSIGSERKPDDSDTGPTGSSFSSSPSSSATEGDDQESDSIDQTQSSSSYSRSPIQISPTRKYFPRRERVYSEKGTGRLRRIKNKLGLIFHHHHHHHHHHRDHHRSSNWKLLQRIFHSKNTKHVGVKDRKGIERKSVVKRSGGHNKNIKHFNALVEGLMKHVGGSGSGRRVLKKPGMGGGGGRNNTRLRKGKGIGLWQRFGRRGGMKMVNRRGHVRVVRFAKKTPKLKM